MKYIFKELLFFIYLILGRLKYYVLARDQEAIFYFDKALELKPYRGDVFFNRGNAKYFCHYFEDAIKDFDKSIELGFIHKDLYLNRGNSNEELGKLNDALLDFNKARLWIQNQVK